MLNLRIPILILGFLILNFKISSQSLDWIYLSSGQTTASCTSTTDTLSGVVCLGLEYTPGITGNMTSYTFSFLSDCVNNVLPTFNLSSCIMVDNSATTDQCASFNKFLFNASANGGSVPVVANTPIIVHQVCITIPAGTAILFEDAGIGQSVSLDTPGGPMDDTPTFSSFIVQSNLPELCDNNTVCGINFGSMNSRMNVTNNANGNISDGAALPNSLPITQSFDIYDEINEYCSLPGGVDDISITFELINTSDQNGNGIIDALGGVTHKITQGANGLIGELPFGQNITNETSSGDTRGYVITVNFEPHIAVLADQISVDLSGLNSAGIAYESARLVFLDNNHNPYGTANYQGFFGGETDLLGTCLPTTPVAPWQVTGNGVVVFHNTNTMDLMDPCNPVAGSPTMDTVSINARTDAGLDSAAVIRGFALVVIGEDVAAPNLLDDGSNANGEDNIRANRPTSTSDVLVSSLLGYKVNGCVFDGLILSVEYLSFDVTKKGEGVELNWVTFNEVNHNYFDVEWSNDGKYFQKIETIKDPAIPNRYQYYHENPLSGINYYRLKQVDYDGNFEYSATKSIVIDGSRSKNFMLFPNPFNDILNINLDKVEDYPINYTIYSIEGNLVERGFIEAGVKQLEIRTAHYNKGQYILQLNNSYKRIVKI